MSIKVEVSANLQLVQDIAAINVLKLG